MDVVGAVSGLTPLNLVYLALLGVGVVYTLVILVGGELADLGGGELGLGGHDLSFEHGDVHVAPLSPVTVASFVTAFGAFGLIASGLFDASARGSLLWAVVGAVAVSAVAHFAFGYFLIRPQVSSEVLQERLAGTTAEVIIPISPDRPGEIAFVARGARVTAAARGAGDESFPRGALVTIERMVGSQAIVRPLSEQS
jgi:hypothetical protein